MTAAQLSVLSVNVGLPRVIATLHGEEVLSGIAKQPVTAQRVTVRTNGIEGDAQADLKVHGGPEKAVYVYPAEHWPWWESEHQLFCAPNSLGENLTLAGADEGEVCIGDTYRWGEVLLQVCQPRSPCFKLAIHTKRPDVPQAMIHSTRCGWYLRVLEEGTAPVYGASLNWLVASGGPSVREAFAAAHHPGISLDVLRRIHEAQGLSQAWQDLLARKIGALRR